MALSPSHRAPSFADAWALSGGGSRSFLSLFFSPSHSRHVHNAQLRLDKDQRIALEEAEAAVDEAKADLKAAEGEDGAPAAAAAAVKVGEAQAKLASLEEAFTADALAKAKDGNAPRPSERRRALDEAEYGGEGRGYGGEGRGDRGGDRGGDRRGGDRDRGGDRGGGGGGDSQEYANFGGRAGAGGGGNFNQDRY